MAVRDFQQESTMNSAPVTPSIPHTLHDVIEAFMLSRHVGNCSVATLRIYTANLMRFEKATGVAGLSEIDTLAIQRYLNALRDRMKPVSVHQHFRTLRTFFNWAVGSGLLADTPLRCLTLRVPKALPRVPSDEEVRALFSTCSAGWEGGRNRALLALLADGGLRISEALRLRVEDIDFAAHTLTVRGGKGGKDRLGFYGAEAARLLQAWLAMRPGAGPADFLFVARCGRPLTRDYGTHLLHRLSGRAGLPHKWGPHSLRHYAATSLLRRTGNLELVRQVLGHESLSMTLRYARLVGLEVAQQFRPASPLDNLSNVSNAPAHGRTRGEKIAQRR